MRGKDNRHDRVPRPPDVGEALADYIKSARKTASRALIVTDRQPHRSFKDGQLLNNIFKAAFTKAELKPPTPYVGSHILRHSLATNLVQRSASLDEIGKMFRHRSRSSTMLYAGREFFRLWLKWRQVSVLDLHRRKIQFVRDSIKSFERCNGSILRKYLIETR